MKGISLQGVGVVEILVLIFVVYFPANEVVDSIAVVLVVDIVVVVVVVVGSGDVVHRYDDVQHVVAFDCVVFGSVAVVDDTVPVGVDVVHFGNIYGIECLGRCNAIVVCVDIVGGGVELGLAECGICDSGSGSLVVVVCVDVLLLDEYDGG